MELSTQKAFLEGQRKRAVDQLLLFTAAAGLAPDVRRTDFDLDRESQRTIRHHIRAALIALEEACLTPSLAYQAEQNSTLQKMLKRCSKKTPIRAASQKARGAPIP